MKRISQEELISDYNSFVKKAENLVENGDFKNALTFIETCARIAYNFNFIYNDATLESLLTTISNIYLQTPSFQPISSRYVFYDYFGNTVVLTQQYVRAIVSWNQPFLYILENTDSYDKKIVEEITAYDKGEIFILDGKMDQLEKMKLIQKRILEYAPKKALLHTAPWDVVGVCVWNSLPDVERYLINLTDHAFWLGKSCSDHILEFRTYGYNLSFAGRKIAKDKLMLQPYYPIQDQTAFLKFPVDLENKVVGFSGASFYKVYGRNAKFLELIKRALNENKNFIFLMAGWGIDAPIRKFIADNKFEDRFILLGKRTDINEVFKHIDIFVNTYPFIGGLMTQLAIVNEKAIVSYTSPDLTFNLIEDFLTIDREKVKSMQSEDAFAHEINCLIRDADYREQNIKSYKNSIPTVDEFNAVLYENMHSKNASRNVNVAEIDINYEAIFSLYLEIDNDFLKIYQKLKLLNLGTLYFKYFPLSALKCSFQIFIYDFKTVKKRLIKYITNS